MVALEDCDGVVVVCRAVHMCMLARGVEKPATSTMTTVARGSLATDPVAKVAAVAALIKGIDDQL